MISGPHQNLVLRLAFARGIPPVFFAKSAQVVEKAMDELPRMTRERGAVMLGHPRIGQFRWLSKQRTCRLGNSYDYQNKRVTNGAFRMNIILKDLAGNEKRGRWLPRAK